LNGIGPKRHPAPNGEIPPKGIPAPLGNLAKTGISPLGRVFTPKWQHFAFGKSEKRRKISPFLLCQTEINAVSAKSPL
jgi:hypothetical protein